MIRRSKKIHDPFCGGESFLVAFSFAIAPSIFSAGEPGGDLASQTTKNVDSSAKIC
jgi:predicted ABC-type transport system involved in lysophospholipase L1 biosynthesis ATPase subunit